MDTKIPEKLSISEGFMEEILSLSEALGVAVDAGFMKREHAGAIWKRILTISGIDTTKKEVKEEDAIT